MSYSSPFQNQRWVNPQVQRSVFKKSLESKEFKGLFRKDGGWIRAWPHQSRLLSVWPFLSPDIMLNYQKPTGFHGDILLPQEENHYHSPSPW